MKIRSCREARQVMMEMHPGEEKLVAALDSGVEKARDSGIMMSKHMRSQEEGVGGDEEVIPPLRKKPLVDAVLRNADT